MIYVLLIAASVWSLVMSTEHSEQRRAERSVASHYSSSEVDAELGREMQWLREKTAQVYVVLKVFTAHKVFLRQCAI